MQPVQVLLAVIASVILLSLIRSAVRKHRDRKQRDAARKLETVLQPRETVKVICPQKKGRVILTSTRVLFETAQGFHAVPIKTIKRVQGTNAAGNRTTVPAKMVSLTIKAEKDHTIKNNCDEFPEFAAQLMKKTAKKPKQSSK